MNNPRRSFRFQVALSFPGEHRTRVEKIAEVLAKAIGKEKILYDRWHQGEFARPNLDAYLASLYREQSRLLVFFLSGAFADKEWCGLEWRAGRDLLKRREDDRLMFLRLDSADIPGIFSIDGYIDINGMPDDGVAQEIRNRLRLIAPVEAESMEGLVRNLRTQTLADTRDRCATIRILTMEQPIELGSIYTDVHILENRPAYSRKTRDELVEEFNRGILRTSANLNQQTERVVARKVIEDHRRLMIYGKPGAGKTTFLKRIAMDCATGGSHAELVPVFITLRDLSEAVGSPGLFSYIQRRWADHPGSRAVFQQGRVLILLDGLDEVREQDFPRIRNEIEGFASEFLRCTIVISCRIAAREYAFERFAEVELADFTRLQIGMFSERWFNAQNERGRAPSFMEKLEANEPILALASSPLLLTLLLLVFQERNDFGGTRSELYREAVEILLRKWDARRGIERERPYRLWITDMEILTTEIAYRRFLASEYFFDKSSLEGQIDLFFKERSLVEACDEFAAERVLNSIESHIGLLVQRALDVYSFPHLTFQEYLAAQRVAKKPTLISEIGGYIGHPRWREFWLLLVTMVDADDIVTELSRRVDMLAEGDPVIQSYLEWCRRKASKDQSGLRPAALRAFFFRFGLREGRLSAVLTQANDQTRILNCDRTSDGRTELEVALIVGSANALVADRALDPARDRDLARVRQSKIALAQSLDPAATHYPVSEEDTGLDLALKLALELSRNLDPYVYTATGRALSRALERTEAAAELSAPQLSGKLRALRDELPKSALESNPRWLQQLRAAAIQYRDLGHEWNWSRAQLDRLNGYYRANQLLIECMNGARTLTKKVRQKIEDTMLLGWAK